MTGHNDQAREHHRESTRLRGELLIADLRSEVRTRTASARRPEARQDRAREGVRREEGLGGRRRATVQRRQDQRRRVQQATRILSTHESARPRSAFQVLMMSEESRLGPEAIETGVPEADH